MLHYKSCARVTMNKVKKFLAIRAIKHLEYFNNSSIMQGKLLIFDECSLVSKDLIFEKMFLYIFSTQMYDVLIQFVILLHIRSIFFEPQTINELISNN